MANQVHRPFRMPHESAEEFDARMEEHAARVDHASDPQPKGPHWQNPREPRKAEPKAPTDYLARARAALGAEDQRDPIIAAVIVAQALDRLTEKIIEAAAVANYKRSP